MTKVVNLRHEPFDVYIGRSGRGYDGKWGNPHVIGYCPICMTQHDRVSAIAAFKKDFIKRIKEDKAYRLDVLCLAGKTLGCFCAPAACHGDVIKEWLDKYAV